MHESLPLPLLVVAGMSRAGTTFLYHNLQRHPGIFAPARKEVCYFAHNHDEGEEWFRRFYLERSADQVALDVCGLYFMHPRALDRIAALGDAVRVVVGIREPVGWAFSLYEQYAGIFDVPPLVDFYSGCSLWREGKEIRLDFHPGMIEERVARLRELFGERLLIFDFGLLADDPTALLREIEDLAGLHPFFAPGNFTDARINARGRKRSRSFERLLQIGGVANLISRFVPRELLLTVRRRMEIRNARGIEGGARPPRTTYSEAEIARVQQLFAHDRRFVEDLFRDGPLLRNHG